MEVSMIYSINTNYIVNEVNSKGIILEPSGREIYILGDVEYGIYKLFDGVKSLGSIISELEAMYNVKDISDDVFEFCNQLLDKGVIIPNGD